MNYKKVKIVATLGPATESKTKIKQLVVAGTDIFRINLSHSSPDDALEKIKKIKQVEKELKKPLAVLADLAGPKIRLGEIKEGTKLESGKTVQITSKRVLGNSKLISVKDAGLLKNIKKNTGIFLDDGRIILRALKYEDNKLTARVVVGGNLRSKVGFMPQGIEPRKMAVSAKDKKDVAALAKAGVTAFAISFVQTKGDVNKIRKMLPQNNDTMLLAKIETPSALKNIESIVDAADGVMVARGDLGLAVPMQKTPFLQKKIINLCLENAKPVIIATQMLSSMQENPLPTRAEVTDVAYAILNGTDAVMLSNETTVGKFPIETIKMASSIIEATEQQIKPREFPQEREIADAVSASVVHTAQQVEAKIIIVLTKSGRTAQRISRHRYNLPIIATSLNENTIHKLIFSWGVHPISKKQAHIHNFNQLLKQTQKIAKNNGVVKLKKGDKFVVSAGVPFDMTGTTNLSLVGEIE